MKKIYLLFVMLTLALGVFAQSKGKNAMTLRLVDIKVTDGTLVNIAKEQEAKGNTKPMDMIRIYEGNVRAKLDEVAKASGRFEISDENALEALTRDAEASLFMKMSRAEKIEYVSSKQNDYTLSCDINSCQFTRRAGGAGYSCVLRLKVSITDAYFQAKYTGITCVTRRAGGAGYSCVLRLKVSISDARDSTAAALISREFISDIKKTAIRPNRDAACQEALATLTEPLTDFFLNNIPVYGLLGYEGDEYVITCGESLNIRKGDQFQVSLIKYSGGERQSEVVGAVKVQDLRASTSAVSFTEGKDRIIELIPTLDANSFLQCRLLLLKSR